MSRHELSPLPGCEGYEIEVVADRHRPGANVGDSFDCARDGWGCPDLVAALAVCEAWSAADRTEATT